MFGSNPLGSGFSIGKVVGGISKTLNVVNQVIPLYKEAKPMIQNARNAISLIKEFSNTATTKVINNTDKNIKPLKEKIEVLNNNNGSNLIVNQNKNKKGPTFFL